MERLQVKNFLTIKDADIEIKKLNILIGAQASGKSVIAKLVHYFESLLQKTFPDAVQSLAGKRELDKTMLQRFESIFPRHTWEGSTFSIIYQNKQIQFEIEGSYGAQKNTLLKIKYSKNVYNLFNRMKTCYQKHLSEPKDNEITFSFGNIESRAYFKTLKEVLSNSSFQNSFNTPIFIPASRSFFANLQKNIFSFLASNIDIDPFIKEFGNVYQNSKFMHKSNLFGGSEDKKTEKIHKEIAAIATKIVNGEYEYFDDQDWIIQRGRRTNLANGSSGQQEALPMMIVLACSHIFTQGIYTGSPTVFIEEPEAHLFPFAQHLVLSAISVLYHEWNTRFFITTHSPYILSAVNNLMYANDLIENKKSSKEKIAKIIGKSNPINFDQTSAYTLKTGKSVSILDKSERLISTQFIDSTSEILESEFSALMEEDFG